MSKRIYQCTHCNWRGTPDEMNRIDDIGERVAPGELFPAGQCPDCKSLIEVDDRDVDDNTIRLCMQIGQCRLLADSLERTRVPVLAETQAQRAIFGATQAELDAMLAQRLVPEVTPAFLVISMLSDAQELLAMSASDEPPTQLSRINQLLNAAKYALATHVLPNEHTERA